MAPRNSAPHESRDWVQQRASWILWWGLPIAAIVVSGSLAIDAGWLTAIWTIACLIMGGGCLQNAYRCGRIHCYFTGPFFIAMAAVTFLNGTDVLPLGPHGWNLIGIVLLAGGAILTYAPEHVLGKYRAP